MRFRETRWYRICHVSRSTAHAEVPPGIAIWVRPASAANGTREIARRIAAALAAHGHRMREGAGNHVLFRRSGPKRSQERTFH